MTDDRDSAPVEVPLPAPVDRRMRLGPFPSVRDSLKFLGYAAVGAAVASVTNAIVWLPFLAVGFVLAVYRPDGKSVDEQAGAIIRYGLRRREPNGAPTGPIVARGDRFAESPDGRFWIAVVRTDGIPLAFLPPTESEGLFRAFQSFLRSNPSGLCWLMTLEPMIAGPFRPGPDGAARGPEGTAREGYDELVRLLCRRRHRRAVLLLLWEERRPIGGDRRLEDRLSATERSLATLGVSPERLEGEELAKALVRFGWATARRRGG